MAMITIKIEGKRGCGFRKKGGIYLVADGAGETCIKLPIPLTVCPCCASGIKQARGWTWISSQLVSEPKCTKGPRCKVCPLEPEEPTRMGLLWVGETFYPTPRDFMKESSRMGISKRIAQVPNDFKVGQTWIMLAHARACGTTVNPVPGIFTAFRPARIEYVVKGTEPEEELDHLGKRGFSLVNVINTETDTNLRIGGEYDT